MQVEEYISKNRKVKENDKAVSVPDIVNILDQEQKTVASSTSSSSVQNDRLQAFLSILFSKPNYNKYFWRSHRNSHFNI